MTVPDDVDFDFDADDTVPQRFRVVFDADDKSPYCPILQAVYGGDGSAVSRHFDSEFWHVAPTDRPAPASVTAAEMVRHNGFLTDLYAAARAQIAADKKAAST